MAEEDFHVSLLDMHLKGMKLLPDQVHSFYTDGYSMTMWEPLDPWERHEIHVPPHFNPGIYGVKYHIPVPFQRFADWSELSASVGPADLDAIHGGWRNWPSLVGYMQPPPDFGELSDDEPHVRRLWDAIPITNHEAELLFQALTNAYNNSLWEPVSEYLDLYHTGRANYDSWNEEDDYDERMAELERVIMHPGPYAQPRDETYEFPFTIPPVLEARWEKLLYTSRIQWEKAASISGDFFGTLYQERVYNPWS